VQLRTPAIHSEIPASILASQVLASRLLVHSNWIHGVVTMGRPKRKASQGVTAAVASLNPGGAQDQGDDHEYKPSSKRAALGNGFSAVFAAPVLPKVGQEEGSGDSQGGQGECGETSAEGPVGAAGADAVSAPTFGTDVVTNAAADGSSPPPPVVPSTVVAQPAVPRAATHQPLPPKAGQKLVWTEEEDLLMKRMVKEYGEGRWSIMADALPGKNAKQCRRRWMNHLGINAKHTDWNDEEDDRLVEYHRRLGNKWTAISKEFGDRTDNACKNRWHAILKRRPELAQSEAPISAVGVRHGTKTHSKIQESSLSLSNPSVGDKSLNASIKGPNMSKKRSSKSKNNQGPAPSPFDAPLGAIRSQPSTANEYLAAMMASNGTMGNIPNVSLANLPTGLSNLGTLAGLGTTLLPNEVQAIGNMIGSMQQAGGGNSGNHPPTMITERNAQAFFNMMGNGQLPPGLSGALGNLPTNLGTMDFSDSFQKNLDGILAGVDEKDGAPAGLSSQALHHLLSFNPNVVQGVAKPTTGGQGAAGGTTAGNDSMTTNDTQKLLDRSLIAHRGGSTLEPSEKLVLDNVLAGGGARDGDNGDNGDNGGNDASAPKKPDALANLDAIAATQSNLYAADWGKALKSAEKSAATGAKE